MRKIELTLLLNFALALGATTHARAGTWGLGADAALSISQGVAGSAGTTRFGLPSAGNFVQPGLRLAYQTAGGAGEFFLGAGFSERMTSSSANLQLNLAPGRKWRPYLNLGVGRTGYQRSGTPGEEGWTDGVFVGGGLGVRRWIAGGHASLRLEARHDSWLLGNGATGQDSGTEAFGLRLGFDLWLR